MTLLQGMNHDIYGNRLEDGFCEVHPHVAQEYPCALCVEKRAAAVPMCGVCGRAKSVADSCGVPVCSEECSHEAERRSGEVDGLRAELAALRADAERLEWYFGPASKADWLDTFMTGVRENWTVDQWRAAIDAAMRGEG